MIVLAVLISLGALQAQEERSLRSAILERDLVCVVVQDVNFELSRMDCAFRIVAKGNRKECSLMVHHGVGTARRVFEGPYTFRGEVVGEIECEKRVAVVKCLLEECSKERDGRQEKVADFKPVRVEFFVVREMEDSEYVQLYWTSGLAKSLHIWGRGIHNARLCIEKERTQR